MRVLVSASVSVLFLAGCGTVQENPNYQFSSRYDAERAAVTGTMPMEATAVVYETQSASTPDFGELNAAGVLAGAPTDAAYTDQNVTGTPGYMALVEPADTAKAAGSRVVDYDYSQNLIVADAVTGAAPLNSEVRVLTPAGKDYTVQVGDTVYGLSRRTCVGVDVLRTMNGIGTDYGIDIGQTLRLPESRC